MRYYVLHLPTNGEPKVLKSLRGIKDLPPGSVLTAVERGSLTGKVLASLNVAIVNGKPDPNRRVP